MRQSRPEQLGQLTLPGLPKGVTRPPAKKKRAASWSPDENQFADWAIAEWNRVFAGVRGAYRAYGKRRNRFVAISFHRRNQQRPPQERFSREDISTALRAYRNDPANVRIEAWQRFQAWWRDAEENIDHRLSRARVVQHRIRQPKTVKRKTDSLTAAAKKVINHEGLVNLCELASRGPTSLRQSLAEHPSDYARRMLSLINRHGAISPDARKVLTSRALNVFRAYYHRVFSADTLDVARLEGIELALLDLDATQRTTNATRRKGADP